MNYDDALTKLYEDGNEEFADALMNGLMEPISDSWDDDVAEVAILERFIGHYAALDNAIDAARAERDYNDDVPIVFVWHPEQMQLVRLVPQSSDLGIGCKCDDPNCETVDSGRSDG